jgi:predicted dienelactone hydrolase
MVIPAGNGTIMYTSGAETSYINNMSTVSEQEALSVETQNKQQGADLTAKQEQIAELDSEMEAMRSAGNIAAYNAQVSLQNSLISAYNAEAALYRQQVALDEAYADVYNYIITHVYDRKGTYTWVKANTLR